MKEYPQQYIHLETAGALIKFHKIFMPLKNVVHKDCTYYSIYEQKLNIQLELFKSS